MWTFLTAILILILISVTLVRGVTVYISNKLKISEVSFTDDKLTEHVWLRLKLHQGQ